jgi:uncharacterized OsmC-like protein
VVQPENLIGNVVGEVEKEGGILVLRRIHVKYDLWIAEDILTEKVRDTVARVLEMHADRCPVAKSIKGAIEVTTEVEFR